MNTPLVPMPPAQTYKDEALSIPKCSDDQSAYISGTIVPRAMGQASKRLQIELREASKRIKELEAVISPEPDKQVAQKLIAALAKIAENEVTLTTARASVMRIIADIS